MDYRISSRLTSVLEGDKMFDPQRICQILEKELLPIIENFLALDGGIKVRYKKENFKNIFFIEFSAERIKPIGYIPYWDFEKQKNCCQNQNFCRFQKTKKLAKMQVFLSFTSIPSRLKSGGMRNLLQTYMIW